MMRWQSSTFERLNAPVKSILGDKTAAAFAKLRVHTVGDLMRHLPRRYLRGVDENSDLSELVVGEQVAVLATVKRMTTAGSAPKRLEVILTDGRNDLRVTFFAPRKKEFLTDFWQLQLSMSQQGIFIGKVGEFNQQLQLTHPDFVMIDPDGAVVGKGDKATMVSAVSRSGLVGMYPSSSALPTWTISASAQLALEHLVDLPEPLPSWILDEMELPGLVDAFRAVHEPTDVDQAVRGANRLRFDEALALQVTMAFRRLDQSRFEAPQLAGCSGGLLDAFDARLPFTLTAGQERVCSQIFAELATAAPMQRLLQGEVGSGKTLVALRAMLRAVDSGQQAVLLAPTEVLAAQHAETITTLLGDLGEGQVLGAPEAATEVVLLSGSLPAAAKKQAMAKAANGEAGIVVGTHALLADAVSFASLGLVVVDEQHRFGVEQRAKLNDKAQLRPHTLVMTATPIPRSVAMTVFGDLETSTLTELPAGRAEVQTTVIDAARNPAWIDRAWQRMAEEVAAGRQAFVVAPAISGQELEALLDDANPEGDRPLTSVEDLFADLVSGPLAGLKVGMLHGKLPADQKESVMAAFAAAELDVVVATTVIEVGVDVPNASVMVVMDADRFGISQLHQLRGRIGRGEHPGLCLLVSHCLPDSPARQRLDTVAGTRDGFVLAEADLVARREGDVLGARQAGKRSTLRLLRVLDHAELIVTAREIAERWVALDPQRTDPHLADLVTQTEALADGDWMERG